METAIATPIKAPAEARQGIIQWAASTYGVDAGKVMSILRSTCFKVPADQPQASDAEVAALLIVARHYKLNPFLRQIYAFRQKGGGIVPIVGVDGWAKIINDEPQFDGVKFTYNNAPEGALESITATIYRKDRSHPMEITEFLDECYRPTEPWNKTKRRMLRHRAYMQCGRLAFGLSGIHDDDEGEVIAASGQPVALPGGGINVEERKEETSRTSTLAHDLAQRAAGATEAEIIDRETGEVKTVTPELLHLAVEQVMTVQEHADLLDKIMTLPASTERVDLLTKWNARGAELGQKPTTTSAPPASGPGPSATVTSSPEATARADTGGASAPEGAGKRREPSPPKPKAEKPPEKPAEAAVDDAACDAAIKEMGEAKAVDELHAVAERENKKKWPSELRRKIYDEYLRLLKEKWGEK